VGVWQHGTTTYPTDRSCPNDPTDSTDNEIKSKILYASQINTEQQRPQQKLKPRRRPTVFSLFISASLAFQCLPTPTISKVDGDSDAGAAGWVKLKGAEGCYMGVTRGGEWVGLWDEAR